MNPIFDPDCRRCPRLAAFLDAVHAEEPELLLPARAAVRRCRRAPRSSWVWRRVCTALTAPVGPSPAIMPASCYTARCTSLDLLPLLISIAPMMACKLHRCAHYQLGQVPATGQQAAARRGQGMQRLSAGRAQTKPECTSHSGAGCDCACGRAARVRSCRRPVPLRAWSTSMHLARAGCCLIHITAAATTPRRGG